MGYDLFLESVKKGFVLLPDETALGNSAFQVFLMNNRINLPPRSVLLLRGVCMAPGGGNSKDFDKILNLFRGVQGPSSPLILAGYDKPVTSALSDRGGKYHLAVITADPAKAAIYAGISTPIRHQTILIDGADFTLIPATTKSQAVTSFVAASKTPPPPFAFNYYGDSKKDPPPKGDPLDTGFVDNEEGKVFLGSSGKKYTAVKLLNPGGATGRVYESDDPNLVIKRFLDKQLYTSERERLRMMCSKPLKHPNIIWPMETVSIVGPDGKTYKDIGYVMQSCKFANLKNVNNSKVLVQRFPTREILIDTLVQLCDGFEYCLAANVVNGDIKLENVVNDDKRHVPYIIDFDAVQIDQYINRTFTDGYIPPEVYAGMTSHGGRPLFFRKKYSDYYAISMLFFRILLGIDFPYSTDGALDETAHRDATFKGDFVLKGKTVEQLRKSAHIVAVIRWMHLPSFIRDAFIDTFDSKGKHYLPDKRLSPSDWKRLFQAYLKMIRDPNSKLAKADKEYYQETAPLFKHGTKEPAELPLSALVMDYGEEITASNSALSLESAIGALALQLKLGLGGASLPQIASELKAKGTYKAGDAITFTLKENLPFLKTVECKAWVAR